MTVRNDNFAARRQPVMEPETQVRILAVIPHVLTDYPFLWSQVYSQFKYHNSQGRNARIICLQSKLSLEPDAILVPVSSASRRIVSFLRVGAMLYRQLKSDGVDYLYARDVWGGLIAWAAKQLAGKEVKLMFDFRGAVPEEILFSGQSPLTWLRANLFRIFERFVARRSQKISCVTEELRQHVEAKYRVKVTAVVPCCLASQAFSATGPGWEEGSSPQQGLTFVYLGGLAKWQNFELVCAIVGCISEKRPGAIFKVITSNIEEARAITRRLIPRVHCEILSVPSEQVPGELAGCNAGFLLRDDIVVNHVASPIKFAEYLAADVPVMTSQGLKDVSREVRKNDLGVVLDLRVSAEVNAERVLRYVRRPRAPYKLRDYAHRAWTWQSKEAVFTHLYSLKDAHEY